MPGELQFIYWDACVFLSYLNGNPDRLPTIDALLEEAKRDGSKKIVTSILSVVEVAYAAAEKASQVLDPQAEGAIDALWEDISTVEIVELHERIARRARELVRQAMAQGWSLKVPDAIHLATAQWVRAHQFHTYDEQLTLKRAAECSAAIECPISEPLVSQPRLL